MFTLKNLVFLLTLLAAVGCGLMAGVFFAFSTFVMKGLARLPVPEAIAAMNSINASVSNSLFGAAFGLTPLICILTMIVGLWRWESPSGVYILAGGLFYLISSLLVTIVFNIPLNNTLAAAAPTDPNGASVWKDFFDPWMFWNHVRTLGSLAAAVFFILALRY